MAIARERPRPTSRSSDAGSRAQNRERQRCASNKRANSSSSSSSSQTRYATRRCVAFNLEAAIISRPRGHAPSTALKFSHAFTRSLCTPSEISGSRGGTGGRDLLRDTFTDRALRTTHVRIDRVDRVLHSHAYSRWQSRNEHNVRVRRVN